MQTAFTLEQITQKLDKGDAKKELVADDDIDEAMDETIESAFDVAEYDLTSTVIPYLDKHLSLMLLEFLERNRSYKEWDLLAAKYSLASKTGMMDFAIEHFKELYPGKEVPQELVEKKQIIIDRLEQSTQEAAPIIDLINNDSYIEELRSKKINLNRDYLKEHHKEVTDEVVEKLYDRARLFFDIGNYGEAADMLQYYKYLSRDEDRKYQALWGKLASDLVTEQWKQGADDLAELKAVIDARPMDGDYSYQLMRRSWLLHWGLFVWFRTSDGFATMTDMIMNDNKLKHAIETDCPHLLRYLTVAVICGKHRRSAIFNDYVRVVQEESHFYSDPITQFLLKVHVDFDFSEASKLLGDAERILEVDYFASACKDDFVREAKALLFETIARVHKFVSISSICKFLSLKDDETAERAIVEFINNSNIDAKIDSNNRQLVFGTNVQSVYHQVSSGRPMIHRTGQMLEQVTKKYQLLMELETTQS